MEKSEMFFFRPKPGNKKTMFAFGPARVTRNVFEYHSYHISQHPSSHCSSVLTPQPLSVPFLSPAVCGQIEGDAESLLAGLDVLPVELVALLDRGEAGVLADRPRPLGVHGRVRTSRERELARQFRRRADGRWGRGVTGID